MSGLPTSSVAAPRPPNGPLVIGIAGGSGSGKTTVANRVKGSMPSGEVVMLEHDAYYRDRPDLSFDERTKLNYDHPDSLETELLVEHIRALRHAHTVDTPIYDFRTHRRSPEVKTIKPSRVIIVEGILVFEDDALRKEFDVRIYVDTDADIRAFRRIRRDIEQRGRSFDSIREQYYRTVRPMHLQFVEPSKRHAHVILPEGGDNLVGIDFVRSFIGTSLAKGRAAEAAEAARAPEEPRAGGGEGPKGRAAGAPEEPRAGGGEGPKGRAAGAPEESR